jgi:flagellar protein FliS
MTSNPSDSYFATQVLSAPRHKLHLMLLEGALRHGRRAEQLLVAGHAAAAAEALIHSQEIIAELLAGLKPELAPPLVRRVAGVYVFMHRGLVMAASRQDVGELREVLRVLELECETWRQVGQQMDGPSTATVLSAEPRVPRPAFLDSRAGVTLPGQTFEA